MSGYVYLLQPREMRGSTHFKIGMSSLDNLSRMKKYGKGTKYLCSIACSDPANVERQIINEFMTNYKLVQGREYFDITNDLDAINRFIETVMNYKNAMTDQTIQFNPENEIPLSMEIILQPVIDMIRNEQNRVSKPEIINIKLFELMMLLPDYLFSENDIIIRLIYAMRNDNIVFGRAYIDILHKLFTLRAPQYLYMIFTKDRSDYNQRKSTVAAIKKIVYHHNRKGFEAWARKWKPSTANQLRYRAGTIVKLSDVLAIYDKKALSERMAKNPRLVIARKHICKSCKKLHYTGCCSEYSSSNRSSAMFILNGYLSK